LKESKQRKNEVFTTYTHTCLPRRDTAQIRL
jgi:hypothetical protein